LNQQYGASIKKYAQTTPSVDGVSSRDEIKPVQAINILKVLKKVDHVENFEKNP
jgi:hypothetical protein